jgi:hypothetical protein
VGGGEDLLSSADLDGAVAACGADELLDAPAGLVLNPMRDHQCSEHDREVGT